MRLCLPPTRGTIRTESMACNTVVDIVTVDGNGAVEKVARL